MCDLHDGYEAAKERSRYGAMILGKIMEGMQSILPASVKPNAAPNVNVRDVARTVSAYAYYLGCTLSDCDAAANYGIANGVNTLDAIKKGKERAIVLRSRYVPEPPEAA